MGLDALSAVSLNPCDEEIGADDGDETRFRVVAAKYRALVFCCSTTLALLGSDPHLFAALACATPRCRSMSYGKQCVPSQFPRSISLCTCVWFMRSDPIDLVHADGSNSLFRMLEPHANYLNFILGCLLFRKFASLDAWTH